MLPELGFLGQGDLASSDSWKSTRADSVSMNHIVYLGKAAEPILILAPSALWNKSLR